MSVVYLIKVAYEKDKFTQCLYKKNVYNFIFVSGQFQKLSVRNA